MKNYNEIIDKLRQLAITDQFINSVSKGSIDRLANAKIDMYPICHIQINSMQIIGNISVYNVSFILMDIIDVNKEDTPTLFNGNDNEDYILHTMNEVALHFYEQFRRGTFSDTWTIHLYGETASVEYFSDRLIDKVAGCTLTLDLAINHQSTIC